MAEEEDGPNEWKEEKKEENLGDLLIGRVVKDLQGLEAKINDCTVELFRVCKWSISPLMVACLLGYKDIVKFLLDKGANAKEKCTEEMNTPLHYACMMREYIEGGWLQTELYFPCEEDVFTKKEEIIKLLFDHGAVLERNSLGFLPIHCAALFAMEKIVDYFITRDPVTDADRLLAMEVLGVSQSVSYAESSKAHATFVGTLLFRHDNGCELAPFSSELGQHFECKECTTFDELYRLNDKSAMIIHGLLVGDRVLPEKLKQKCLWPIMLLPRYELEKYLCACQYGLELEMSSRLAVGTVLGGIKDLLWEDSDYELQRPQLHQIASCIEKYNEIFMIVEPGRIVEHISDHSGVFSSILKDLSWRYLRSRQSFDVLFEPTIGAIKVYYTEQISAYEKYSVTENLFDCLREMYDSNYVSSEDMRNLLVLWNHVLPILLKYGHKVHRKNLEDCSTMLSEIMTFLSEEKNVGVICAMTRKLVRHGCPIGAKNYAGRTAKDEALVAAEKVEIDHPEFDEILTLLSEPSEVLSLRELSARCVLRSRIPYSLQTVPSTVYDFLNGEDFMKTKLIKD